MVRLQVKGTVSRHVVVGRHRYSFAHIDGALMHLGRVEQVASVPT